MNVSATDLTAAAGEIVSKNNLVFFREHYVQVTGPLPDAGGSNRPLGTGWYPDALIPFVDPDTGSPPTGGTLAAAPFSVQAGRNQPIWVDVFVPPAAHAGQYTGSFTVASDQGSTTGQVVLTVWNFTLPLTPTLKSAFNAMQAPPSAAARTLLRNKVSPLNIPGEDASNLAKNFGLGATNLGLWSGADGSTCEMSPAPAVSEVQAMASKYPHGLYLFNFTADEIDRCTGHYPVIREWGSALHAAGVRNLITMLPVPELFDDGTGKGRSAVDIWAVLPKAYDLATDRIMQALAKGDEVWSYNALVQDPYSPKWGIEFAPIDLRIQPGFISQSLGLTGLLGWSVDTWTSDPWTNVNNAGKFGQANYPGEGMFVYPGSTVGIVGVAPSMRLKWIRDGVEDYEYVALLKKAGRGEWALQIARRVGQDWKSWTRDPKALEAARRQLGEMLDRLAPGGSSGGTSVDHPQRP